MNEPAKELVTLTPMQLISDALTQGANVDAMEKLMGMQERWVAAEAKALYTAALAAFKSQCPSMKRTKAIKIDGVVRSMYASLDEIASTIQPICEACGLVVTYDIDDSSEAIRVGCKVSHVAGHSDTTWVTGEADQTGSKNAIQARGSALSYLQRYSLIGALGITSADPDDDGTAVGAPLLANVLAHMKCVRDNFDTVVAIKVGIDVEDLERAAGAWFELEQDVQKLLWLAPTKGGIFTTEQRDTMKESKFREAHYGTAD